jgi:hypothetical protein
MSTHRLSRHHGVPVIARPVALVCLVLLALFGVVAPAAPPARAASDSGKLLWTRVWDRTAAYDSLDAGCAGPGGTLFACGMTASDWATQGDLLLVKYKPGGGRAWTRAWNGDASLVDWGSAVAADRQGNVIVAGVGTSAGGGRDWVVAKWSAAGVMRWATTYDGPGGGDDGARDLVLDSSGNAYVCGRSVGAFGSGNDLLVAKFRAASGTLAWEERFVGPFPGGDDGAYALAIDKARNTYMVGYSPDSTGVDDALIVKVDADGKRVWARRNDGPAHGPDLWYDVAVVDDRSVCVAGDSGADPATDLIVGRFSTGGTRVWSDVYDNPKNGSDGSSAVAVDGKGALYVAAVAGTAAPFSRTAQVLKWDAAGHLKWRRTYHGSSDAEYWAIAAGRQGNVWCGGYAVDPVSQRDALVVRYTAGGARRWLWRVDSGSLADDTVYALALSGTSDLYAAGASIVPAADFAALVLKFRR